MSDISATQAPQLKHTRHIRRSLLFVPAARPDRFEKALATGADSVCLDLEDGVALSQKDEARSNAMRVLAGRSMDRAEVVLRINESGSDLGKHDLEALLAAGVKPDALMLPKVGGPAAVQALENHLSQDLAGIPLIVQIETAQGLAAVEAIAVASPNIAVLFFGAVDLSAELGCAIEWDALLYARSRVVTAAALVGMDVLDTPFMNVSALSQLRDEARAVQRLGFTGKAAIHPSQVTVIQAAFSPTSGAVEWAKQIIAAYEANDGGVLLVDGKLIEKPVIASARRILASVNAIDHTDS